MPPDPPRWSACVHYPSPTVMFSNFHFAPPEIFSERNPERATTVQDRTYRAWRAEMKFAEPYTQTITAPACSHVDYSYGEIMDLNAHFAPTHSSFKFDWHLRACLYNLPFRDVVLHGSIENARARLVRISTIDLHCRYIAVPYNVHGAGGWEGWGGWGRRYYTAKRAGLTSPEGSDTLCRWDLSSRCQTPRIKHYKQGSSDEND